MKSSLSIKIFAGLFAGFLLGTLLQYLLPVNGFTGLLLGTADGAGTMFVSMIKMMVVPLVFVSIVCGVSELKDLASFGRLGGKTFGLYIANTVIAIVIALTLAMIFQPGAGAGLATTGDQVSLVTTDLPNIGQLLVNIVPANPVQAFVAGDMLQIIFMAILVGLATQTMGDAGLRIAAGFQTANKLMMKLLGMVMSLAPYGVFALMVSLGATLNASTLLSVAGYVSLVVAALILWMVVVYPLAVWAFTGIKPTEFLRKVREQILFSLSTASSNATIPVTMRTLTDKIGVSKSIAGFGVPLGATMNMSGAAIYIAIAVFFCANAFGQPIQADDLFTIGFTVLLLSIGAGGVPGGGVVMIGVLLHQLGLPLEALAIVAAVDRVNDMFCTSTNVVGDTAVNTIVAATEGELGQADEAEFSGQTITA